MAQAYASTSRRRSGGSGYRLTSSDEDVQPMATAQEAESVGEVLHDDLRPHRGSRTLRYWCYGLHVLLVLLHVVLVGMLFRHPEHQFTVSVDNTSATITLKALLQAFYSIYTAILVLMTHRLAIAVAMSTRQKLTAVHDVSGAWNGIGAAISSLWQQTKVASAPSAIVLTLAYFTAISGLHIISSSVIQFKVFNNTVRTPVPSTLAWPSPSVNLSDLTWATISPLMTLWPLLSTAKGLSGSTLYDVPSPDYIYTGAIVNATNITAECGLLPNASGGTLNSTLGIYNISGLGEVVLPASGFVNLVSFVDLGPSFNTSANYPYIGYQVSTGMQLGNLADEVIQVTINSTNPIMVPANMSITSYFVACTLNATSTTLYLPMQNGRTTQNLSQPFDAQSDIWTIWSPTPATSLTQTFNTAQVGFGPTTVFSDHPVFCEEVQSSTTFTECFFMSLADVYINHLLGIQWTYEAIQAPETPLIILGHREMENVVAQTAATFIWLAGTAGTESGGFKQSQGESLISNVVLELRLNVNIVPVIIGLVASLILLAIVVWMFHGSNPNFKRSVISSGVLEMMWISAHSKILQDLMKAVGSSISDQLRLRGMKAEVCLAELASKPVTFQEDNDNNIQLEFEGYDPEWQEFMNSKFFIHCLCYVFHAILLALHVVLILLLKYHPEHHVTMLSDKSWVTIMLSVSLQAFYTLYTAGLVFITQQLAVSAIITQWHYLTAVHDISQAWAGIGAAIYILWQQKKIISSIWTLLGVATYLACISALHIASTTIMEFTAFNSTSTVSVQSAVSWPNNTILTNDTWVGPNQMVAPNTLLENMETIGLLNNTIYDIVNITDSTFTTTIVNATSLQSSCGLLPNLTYSNSTSPTLNFSIDGLGNGSLSFGADAQNFQTARNQIVFFSPFPIPSLTACPLCDQYLFFLITTDVGLDQSMAVASPTLGLSVNIASAGGPPILAYLAACSLIPQPGFAILDLQAGTLNPGPIQSPPQTWKLWSPGATGLENLTYVVSQIYVNTAFGICPQDGFAGCSVQSNASLSAQDSPLYTLTPNQLQQGIEESVAAMIWIGGQLGPSQGGFERTVGESQVTQVITEWRLNINEVPVIFTSMVSLILFIMVIWFTGVPSKTMRPHASIAGISVLQTLWLAAHSRTLRERMAEVEDPSLDNLRNAGKFQICLGDIRGTRVTTSESETLLE